MPSPPGTLVGLILTLLAAAVNLFGKAGASKIRVLESSTEDDNPLEDNIIIGGGETRKDSQSRA